MWRRYQRLLGPDVPADVEDELAFHLEMRTRALVARGMEPEAARAEAVRRFGDLHRVRRECEEIGRGRVTRAQRGEWWGGVGQELRQALRGLLRKPASFVVTLLTLATGIGGVTAVFAVVDAVLLEPLPFRDPGSVVSVGHTTRDGALPNSAATEVVYEAASRSFESMALYEAGHANLSSSGMPPARVATAAASRTLFDVLGVAPALGRVFSPEEDRPGGPAVAILSHRLWAGRFGGAPEMVGRTVQVDGVSREVVGVMPRTFRFPTADADVWVPLQLDRTDLGGFRTPGIARLAPGVTADAAERELARILPTAAGVAPWLTPELLRSTGLRPDVHPYLDEVVGGVRTTLWIVFGMVGLVLLIACVNVANLLLVRAEGRRREIAVRTALGAGTRHLVQRFVAEAALLALAGTLLGIAWAEVALRLLARFRPATLPRAEEIGMDGTVLAFAGVVALLATLAFGLIPALRRDSTPLAVRLRGNDRGSSATRAAVVVRHGLVGVQMALAVMLVTGSGLMLRSFRELRRVELGFDGRSVLTFRISLPEADYPGAEDVARFHREMLERVRGLPGVQAAGAGSHLPLRGSDWAADPLRVEGSPVPSDRIPPVIEMRVATPGYFEALGVPLRDGRPLRDGDAVTRSGAVLVSEAVVRKSMGGTRALGRRVAHGLEARPWSRVVGVVGDVHGVSPLEAPMGAVYYPMLSGPGVGMDWLARSLSYAVRTRVPPLSLVPAIRRIARGLDASLPVAEVETMQAITDEATARSRFTMLLLLATATVGLFLGAVGLYGVISHVTQQRAREIGVRVALGAAPARVRWMVMRQGLAVSGLGIVAGLLGALLLGDLLRSILYDVSARDPVTLLGAAAVLWIVSALATWVPAHRASAADPVVALRSD
jgi:predicted permease